uniref:Coiled-coil-helix-coiled-coil-helix domain-containing protein 2, mitochondrial-like n=1 Tax=Phallusia mammillata TaxID=59560 RepID=A0A6F9D9U5_9ASCI|nr:coiled-coil-helix-coiled-coil-helix domain-containing protein 2, mitochondrial-like [Phallusia mammillata]
MPRGRRSSPSPVRRSAPAPTRQPAPRPPTQMAAPQSQGPGLMGQMAATAGGVAVGSVIGHGVSSALFGGGGGSGNNQSPDVTYQEPPPQQQYQGQQQQQQPQVCSWELQQFLNCAQSNNDISMCEGFNDALKQCKRNYNIA